MGMGMAWLVVVALAEASAPPYEDLVTRYAAGEKAAVLAEVRGWTEKELRRELERLRFLERTAKHCEKCPEKEAYRRFPLRAAVLLHTDLAELEIRSRGPGDEVVPRCGIGPQGVMAEEIALLVLFRQGEADFVRRWFLAMTIRSHADACLADAQHWATAGIRWFPEDAPLLLARGALGETAASLSEDAFSASPGNPARGGRASSTIRRNYLRDALRDFERALRSDPRLAQATLRRGRVQWLLDQRAEALASFDAVLSERDPTLLYLARLFRGRAYEEEKRLPEAEADYRAALALLPESQPATLAISYVTWLQGKSAEAKEVLGHALLLAGRRTAPEPYWDYSFGSTARAEPLFESLRDEVRP